MWYDSGKTLTHNAMINIIVGARGCGKTYSLKQRAYNNFVKRGEQFIYLRRYDSELDMVKEGLFNDVIKANPEYNIEYKQGGMYFIDNELAGWAVSLSKSNYYKSASFPDVTLIIFDEFIIEEGQGIHYLKNEVRKLLDFIETVARMRENVKVFMLANALSVINPYMLYWKIDVSPNKPLVKVCDGLVLCELVGDDDFKEKKRETIFGRLNAGTEYERMSVDNEFILDSTAFLEKREGDARYLFTFTHEGLQMGLWLDYKTGLYYVSEKVDPSCKLVYSTTLPDHSPNKMLVKRGDKGLFGHLVWAFKHAQLRFESQQVKNAVYTIMKGMV